MQDSIVCWNRVIGIKTIEWTILFMNEEVNAFPPETRFLQTAYEAFILF